MAKPWLFFFFLLLLLFNLPPSTSPAPAPSPVQTLLRFKSSLTNTTALSNWNSSAPLCSHDPRYWTGLICKHGTLYSLRLENMNLGGTVDVAALAALPTLRSLSLMNNGFQGPIPNVKQIGALRALYLSNNNFSGSISGDAFEGMGNLKKLYLSRNGFSGEIPASLAELNGVVELGLEENLFEGKIPDFGKRVWKYLNFSRNLLEGPIPPGLKNTNFSSFLGNNGLCGEPLGPCKSSSKKRSILIGVLSAAAALIIFLLLLGCFLRPSKSSAAVHDDDKTKTKTKTKFKIFLSPKILFKRPEKTHQHSSTDSDDNSNCGDPSGLELCFVRADRPRFDFQELLGASAEVLGSGSFGSTYKAALSNGSRAVVVKRFRQMNAAGKDEFFNHMRRLGRLSHPNILPLIAFYYGKDDKLLVTDFVPNGSLASHLHGRRREGNASLDWRKRLKIIKGVARGLSYLHRELPDLSLPHGHLKSSNVLLDQNFTPILSDYALLPLLQKSHAHHHMAAFKSPDFSPSLQHRTSKSTDVWSLGILILEILTGKFPTNYLRQGNGAETDLAAWVDAVVREEWTAEVFDGDLMSEAAGAEEQEEEGCCDWDHSEDMLKLLKIGMCCCEADIGKRWALQQAVEKIEELNVNDEGGEYYSSYGSDYNGSFQSYSSHFKGRRTRTTTNEDESSFLS